ncbi:hypothetical protein KHA80_12060 [Anaerobacillus sp. HL2]|nr:hypothetical protein KHA80_12060 [Anaerobacillus sp. HL2]
MAIPGEFFRCNGFKLIKREPIYLHGHFQDIFIRIMIGTLIMEMPFYLQKGMRIYEQIWKESGVENIVFVHNKEYGVEFQKKYLIKTDFIKIPPKRMHIVIKSKY